MNNTTLPVWILPEGGDKILERYGIKFGNPVEGDTLLQYATLPPGWTKEVCEDNKR